MKATTTDKWEVENLVPLPYAAVTKDAVTSGRLGRVLPNCSRHLLGVLYAWAVYSGRE